MQSGAVPDVQISASSEYDANHAAIQGRLHFKESRVKKGSWSARTNSINQWLEIDLGIQSTNVTRVATQGRNYEYSEQWAGGDVPKDNYKQWVTKYKLQYSDDGVNFQYYREQGQTRDKVKILFDQILLYHGILIILFFACIENFEYFDTPACAGKSTIEFLKWPSIRVVCSQGV